MASKDADGSGALVVYDITLAGTCSLKGNTIPTTHHVPLQPLLFCVCNPLPAVSTPECRMPELVPMTLESCNGYERCSDEEEFESKYISARHGYTRQPYYLIRACCGPGL